jgi:putative flippase GtrA
MSSALRSLTGEGVRYLAASALALAVDFGTYVALIRLGGVYYLIAAPIAFALGLGVIYLLSIGWVFGERRLADSRLEFAIFAVVGIAGMGLNQLVVHAGVERFLFSFEFAKLVSAAAVFCFNFVSRKALLFTKY